MLHVIPYSGGAVQVINGIRWMYMAIFIGVTYIYIYPIGSMYGIYANIGGILMVNVTIYSIHGSYGYIYIYNGKLIGRYIYIYT